MCCGNHAVPLPFAVPFTSFHGRLSRGGCHVSCPTKGWKKDCYRYCVWVLESILPLSPKCLRLQGFGAHILIGMIGGCRCGTNQTGAFLSGTTVPNGLLGLGMQNISIPSILARAKIMADSFSMCFDYGLGTGRLVFGDRGPSKAHSTRIIPTVNP